VLAIGFDVCCSRCGGWQGTSRGGFFLSTRDEDGGGVLEWLAARDGGGGAADWDGWTAARPRRMSAEWERRASVERFDFVFSGPDVQRTWPSSIVGT
jgi:hypothetical protein